MGTKIISISERVYTKLDAERLEGESFAVIKEMREKSRDRTLRIIEETK